MKRHPQLVSSTPEIPCVSYAMLCKRNTTHSVRWFTSQKCSKMRFMMFHCLPANIQLHPTQKGGWSPNRPAPRPPASAGHFDPRTHRALGGALGAVRARCAAAPPGGLCAAAADDRKATGQFLLGRKVTQKEDMSWQWVIFNSLFNHIQSYHDLCQMFVLES